MITYRHIVFALVTIFAILTQLVNPTLAHADGEVPPTPPAEAATEVAPTDIPIATEVPTQPDVLGMDATLTELPAVTEVSASASPTIDPVATDIPAADISTAEEPTPLEIIEQIHAQTDIVALNATGESIPLATQQAAEIIAEGDPMWCPAGATTVTVNCVSAATVSILLPLLASKNEDGIIYFYTPTIYSTNDVSIDGTNVDLVQLADNALTIQGGWNGILTLGSTIAFSGNSVFAVPVQIINWNGDVTVQNITIQGASGREGLRVLTSKDINLKNITLQNGYTTGLEARTSQDITIENFNALNNWNGWGGYINNTTGTGTVTIKGTNNFSNNTWGGIWVNSRGNANISGITAINNFNDDGVEIWHYDGNLFVSDVNASNNGQSGLKINTNGRVTLNNVATNYNGIYGTYLDNTSSSSNASVILTGANIFNGNYNTGLYVLSKGNISASNVNASNNGKDGAYLRTVGNVVVVNSIFSGNQIAPYSGLAVFNSSSTTITNSTFSGNGYGAYLSGITNATLSDNTFSSNKRDGAYISASGNVLITNNSFNGNNTNPYSGLAVFNATNINATNNTFSGNYYGLYLYSVKSISAVDNIFTSNRKYGLAATNGSSISLSNNDITYNCAGVYLNTSAAATINGGSISNNVSGIVKINDASLLSLNGVTISNNINDRTNLAIECETVPTPDSDPVSTPTPISITVIIDISNFDEANGNAAEAEFEIDCIHQRRYIVNLPNGDQVQVFCPVSGKAHISRLDNTALPADLPAGYTYTSAFSLDILRGEKSISVIDEGGYINVSFNIPSSDTGTTYSVLYWDNGRWTPLKDFMTDENGNPRGFNLHADDPRKILSGSNFIFEEGSPTRLEISTNFPGTFVLAQH